MKTKISPSTKVAVEMTARFPCWEGALLPMVFSVRLLLAVSQKIPGFCSYWERVYESKYIAHPPIILEGFPDIIGAGINSRANDYLIIGASLL